MSTSNRETRNRRAGGLSVQACAVIVAVAGMCAWVAHDLLAGAAPTTPLAVAAAPAGADGAGAGDVYVTTPQAAPPVVLLVAPDGSAAVVSGGAAGAADAGTAGAVPTRPSSGGSLAGLAPVGAAPATGAGASGTDPAGGAAAPVIVLPADPGAAGHGADLDVRQDQRVSYQVLAADGSVVYVGADGRLVANTGAVSSSGVLALGSRGSDLRSGRSTAPATTRTTGDSEASGGTTAMTHGNDSFGGLFEGYGTGRSLAISGFEDHSVSVVGSDQVVTYDDSNVFLARNGRINANTGDTDSSGLNTVDVTGSVVRSGNSGDAEDEEGDDADEEEDGENGEAPEQDEQEDGDEPAGPAVPVTGPAVTGTSHATVTDEGASSATGDGALVIGADGFDDVSIRSRGDGNVVTYDDSNVVIGGSGPVNSQIGDSDTGGAVVMGVHGSDVRAGCEGDLCYSD
ncbi:hypothetical protein GCM10010413_36350 [Promicromonospora sukumoe]|uniref:Uncharacterized protein n=1 Tax=Promicromonospora sukumoe TaxID=88382 RepID=A0A7W3J7A9_9MICO|nr:hypothetical protein [Promicromonospora sukumoe]MBA8807578.1 hypothetical protein [Promicromonospora sukumoe]